MFRSSRDSLLIDGVIPIDAQTPEPVDVADSAVDNVASAEDVGAHDNGESDRSAGRPARWRRFVAFCLLPLIAMLLASVAAYLKYRDLSLEGAHQARAESVQAAKDGTVALLSYRFDTVEQDLDKARNRLTGDFKDSYAKLTQEVVIPGAKQRQISVVASAPAAASVSASWNDAVVIVFVNQTTVIGKDAPTDNASTLRVTLKKSGTDWLISGFDPI